MRFYFCAGTSRADDLESFRLALEARDHEVTSRWHRAEHPRLELGDPALVERALSDLDDIDRADAVVAWSGGKSNRGGRHFELGYALASGLPIYLIGPPEHAFHSLVDEQFDTWADFLMFAERRWS